MVKTAKSSPVFGDFTLLVDGKRAFPEIIRCIEAAKRSVEINMFIWREDAIGCRMAEAVLTAADNGARVYISVDRYGLVLEKAEEAKKSFFHEHPTVTERIKIKYLELCYPNGGSKDKKEARGPLFQRVMTHPNITVSRDVFKADHSKFYIIDDEILFLGGINIEDKENGQDCKGRVYGDHMAKLCGVTHVTNFREKLANGADLSPEYRFGANVKDEGVRRFEMEERYLDMIRAAKERLHITMAYFSPLPQFLTAICDAAARGVEVSVLLPGSANFQHDTNMKTAKRLLQQSAGRVRVYLSPRMLHTKLLMTEETVSFGSTNITKKAFGQLSELNLFVPNGDFAFAEALRQSVAHDLAEATEVTDAKSLRYRRVIAALEGLLV
ncbi:MAG: phosphatidylserine/phosphatidylglycerophosphate/cardiolipin synthase family protein [Ruminococcaceae bacterium]|nr:phosphatidylserine/phosphatidylglycerophosphate/cardiolipin synthase family protein [Oscillospiraceae bacterium]